MLNKNDDVANWPIFWAFQSKATTIAQDLQGSSNTNKLKVQLEKAESSLDSTLQPNITLARDNSNLKGRTCILRSG